MTYLHHPEVTYHLGAQARLPDYQPTSARYHAETAFERAFTPHNSPAPIPGAYDRHPRLEREHSLGPHVLLAGHAPAIAQLENGNYSLTYTLPPGHPVLAHHGIFPEEKKKSPVPKEPTKEQVQNLEEKPISNIAQGSSQSSTSEGKRRTIDPHVYDTKYPHLVNHHMLHHHYQVSPSFASFGYANPYAPLFALPHSPSYQHLPHLPAHQFASPPYGYPVLARSHLVGYPLHPPHFYHSSQSQSNSKNLNDAFIEPQGPHHTRHRERLEEPQEEKEDKQ
jgi:hypothetical protein